MRSNAHFANIWNDTPWRANLLCCDAHSKKKKSCVGGDPDKRNLVFLLRNPVGGCTQQQSRVLVHVGIPLHPTENRTVDATPWLYRCAAVVFLTVRIAKSRTGRGESMGLYRVEAQKRDHLYVAYHMSRWTFLRHWCCHYACCTLKVACERLPVV